MQLRLHNEFPDGLWYMSWFDVEEGDFGATLGECITDGTGDVPTDRGDWEHYIAVKTIAGMFPDTQRTTRGWAWDSKRDAMTPWKAIKQAMSQERPLPEWAHKALQEGWKPPKGWKAQIMSTSVPIHQRPVFLNVEQYADFASVAFYVAGGRVEGTIFLTEIGYWQARLIRYQTLDESRDCLVHSMVEHITDKEREPVAMWIARQIDTALQYPHLTSEERRMVEYTNDNLESLIRFPGMWGGPEATELQALQAMEFRDNILHPNNDVRDILYRYNDFLRGVFAKSYRNLPACQILQRKYPEESEIDIITRVSELMGKFNQVLLDSDR